MKTVCYGELLIDMIADGDGVLGYADSFKKHAGGAAANVAVQLAKLGDRACFLGKLGDDSFGHYLVDYLHDCNIDVGAVVWDAERRTTVAFIGLDKNKKPDYLFYRKGGASESLIPEEINLGKIDEAEVLYTSSLMLTSKKVRETTLWILHYAKENGKIVAFDMNFRMTAWEDEEEARNVICNMLPYVNILKINEDELRFLLGKSENIRREKELLKKYPSIDILIVTYGADGAYIFTGKDAACRITADRVDVVDTTGAGDSFMGAFLYAYGKYGKDQEKILEMGRFAAAASELTIQKNGAVEAMPDLDECERYMTDKK